MNTPESKEKRCRIPNNVRKQCLSLFAFGYGYKAVANKPGLNRYTVREYLRRYKAGDVSWADRGPASYNE